MDSRGLNRRWGAIGKTKFSPVARDYLSDSVERSIELEAAGKLGRSPPWASCTRWDDRVFGPCGCPACRRVVVGD